jgi:hypothetical protein
MAGRYAAQDTTWGRNFRTILGRLTRNRAQQHEGPRVTDGVLVADLSPGHWVRAVVDSAVDPATLLGDLPTQARPWRPCSIHRDAGVVAQYQGRSRIVRSDGVVLWDGVVGVGAFTAEWCDLAARPRDQPTPVAHPDWLATDPVVRRAIVEGLLDHAASAQRVARKARDRRDAARR